MASAWGLSWAKAWGNSWGAIVTGGGGASTVAKKKKGGWANERAALEASLWVPEDTPTSKPAKKAKKKAVVYDVPQLAGVKDELRRLELELQRKQFEASQLELSKQEYEAFIQDEEEAIQVLLMVLEYEASLLGIPTGLQSSSLTEV